MKTPAPDTLDMLRTLKNAVAETLERKRRLGHYAVLWKDSKIVFTEGDRDSAEASNMGTVHELKENPSLYNTKRQENN